MPRKPKLRASYTHDAQYLLRMIRAVEEDYSRPKEWRAEVIAVAQELATKLLTAPEQETPHVAPTNGQKAS